MFILSLLFLFIFSFTTTDAFISSSVDFRSTKLFLASKASPSTPKRKYESWNENFERLKEFQQKHGHCQGFQWEKQLISWGSRLQELKKYYIENGHCHVPKDSSGLYWFAIRVRQQYKNGELNQEKIDALNALDFPWKGDTFRRFLEWDMRLQQLKTFAKQNGGDCNISTASKDFP